MKDIRVIIFLANGAVGNGLFGSTTAGNPDI
jgi:hypothetical protein